MLNRGYLGRTLPATSPVTATAESVAAFAESLGQSAPRRYAPPTYLIAVTLPASDALIADEEFGLDFSRVLHREQRFSYHRPVSIGDTFTCAVTVDDIKAVAGNEVLTLRTNVSTVDGEELATVWTTLFVAGEQQ